jgi:hypothetical protein
MLRRSCIGTRAFWTLPIWLDLLRKPANLIGHKRKAKSRTGCYVDTCRPNTYIDATRGRSIPQEFIAYHVVPVVKKEKPLQDTFAETLCYNMIRVSGHSLTLLMKNRTTTVIPGSEAFFALMHLESDAVVHASCLSTTMPLLCCHQPSSDWQYHPDLSKFSRVDCTKASPPVYTFKRNTTIPL